MGRIRERGYHRIAGGSAPEFEGWLDAECGVKPHQTNKYLQVQDLTDEECAERHLGIESMYQVKLAPEGLRPTMWELGEQYSSGALAVGRRRAAALAASGRLEEAQRVLVAATQAQQEREDQKAAARRVSQRAVWERAEATLAQAERTLERMVAGAEPIPAEAVRRVRERLGRLGRLGERLGPAESAAVADVPNVPDAQRADVPNVPDDDAQRADVPNVPDDDAQRADVPNVPDDEARLADVPNVPVSADVDEVDVPVADVPNVPDDDAQRADVPNVPDDDAQLADVPNVPAAAPDDRPLADDTECRPLLKKLARLSAARRSDISAPLYQIVEGAPPADQLTRLSALTQGIGPAELRRRWLEALDAPTWTARGRLAFRSILALRAPGSIQWLNRAQPKEWPVQLRREVEQHLLSLRLYRAGPAGPSGELH